MAHARGKYGVSEREGLCRARTAARHAALRAHGYTVRADEDLLTQAIVSLACQYGRYGYRMITGMLRLGGWRVGKDRVSRIWRKEGLKVPKKQKPRARL